MNYPLVIIVAFSILNIGHLRRGWKLIDSEYLKDKYTKQSRQNAAYIDFFVAPSATLIAIIFFDKAVYLFYTAMTIFIFTELFILKKTKI